MTPEERRAAEAQKSDTGGKQAGNATLVSVPKTAAGRAKLAIQMFERITGRKATPEQVEQLNRKAGL